MSRWTKAAGLIFLASASVYSSQAIAAAAGHSATSAPPATQLPADVKLIADTDPFAATAPATRPATAPQSLQDSAVNVSAAGTVEVHVNDATLVEVLRMLSMQSQKNIIATKEVTGTVTANLYDVTVKEALDAILLSNGYGYKEKGNFIFVYTAKQLAEMEKAERKTVTEAFRLHYTPAANAVTMLRPVLSTEALIASTTPAVGGIASGGTDVGGNSHALEDVIVVTDYPDKLDAARRILKEIDRRPQQILVEATIVRAALTEDNALGVDFNVVGGVDFSRVLHGNSQITGGDLQDGATMNPTVNTVGTGNAFTGGQNGFRVGVVADSVSIFLTALEGITDTSVLANPKLLVLNKQKGEVHVGREDGYRGVTTQTETAATESVQMLSTGIRLIFRPYIGEDGFIRLEVHPEDSSGTVDKVTGLPSKTTTEVTTNVMVKDGHTVVIGGLFREVQISNKSQVPLLGNLPVAGALFRKQADSTQREEVIILLTPHIVKDEASYSAASAEELKQFEKLRVGVRRGMMWTGRERLAEASYDKAVAEMNKPAPDRKKALWHLDAATNLNPLFLEAANLKQSLTGREVATVDNSSIRSFVKRQILADPPKAPATQPVTEPLRVTPTGRPTAQGPATQPVAEAPATQPVADIATTQPVAEAPTTQPIADVAATQPVAEAPATQPVAEAEAPATQPVADVTIVQPLADVPSTEPLADVPATQPVAEVPATQPVATADEDPPTASPATRPAEDTITVIELPAED